jgi:Rifampin ADP-ribosyl transferase
VDRSLSAAATMSPGGNPKFGSGDDRDRSDAPAGQDPGPFYHGTKADLRPGEVLQPGYRSNFGAGRKANYIYLTSTLDAATWGAELAVGAGPGRIYRVEPTGPIEDDPNLTDKKFPGNPTRSYRTQQPLRVVGEIVDWEPHPPEVLQGMRNRLEEIERLGIEAIND